MNHTGVYYLRTLTALFAGAAVLPKVQGPTGHAVRRELQRILTTDPQFKTKPQFDWSQFNWDWVNTLAELLRKPLFIMLVLAIGVGVYFVVRRLTPYLQGMAGEGRTDSDAAAAKETWGKNDFNSCYQQALDHAAAAEYRAAVIALHKATVAYLFNHALIVMDGKKYTNNDLKRKLAVADQTLCQPFAMISARAEVAGFSDNEINPVDFNEALAVFEKYFLNDRRGRP